nr:MAG TPA: hypothetical protein [Caudoviricetes sp.]
MVGSFIWQNPRSNAVLISQSPPKEWGRRKGD